MQQARIGAWSTPTITRLVTDVVTGKLDAREAAAQLPQDEAGAALAPEGLDTDEGVDAEAELEE